MAIDAYGFGDGAGMVCTSDSGTALVVSTATDHPSEPSIEVQQNDPLLGNPIAHLHNASGDGLEILNNGSLIWTTANGASDTRSALGLAIGTDVQGVDGELTAIAGLTSAADKGIQFTGSGTAATYDLTTAGKALLDDASAAAQRTTLGLGTAATANTGTGTSDVPTITQADARYARLYAPSFITYTGGNQNTTSTSFADIHSSAGWNSVAPGFYRFEARIAHNSAALTTGAAFVLNGTITQDYMNGAMFYSANTGDRGAYVMGGTLNAGQASTSSVASGTTMGATITGHINVTATGDIRIAFATEVAGSQIQVTNVVGFIQRIY